MNGGGNCRVMTITTKSHLSYIHETRNAYYRLAKLKHSGHACIST